MAVSVVYICECENSMRWGRRQSLDNVKRYIVGHHTMPETRHWNFPEISNAVWNSVPVSRLGNGFHNRQRPKAVVVVCAMKLFEWNAI